METLACLETRRSHRSFLPTPIPKDVLNQIIEAGRCAPSGGNTQYFHFIVVTNQAILQEMAELVKGICAQLEVYDGMYPSLINSINRSKRGDYVFHYNPPAFVIIANRRGYPNALADTGCVLQNMMLACNDLGLGSCWINQLRLLDSYCGITGEHPELDAFVHRLGVGEDETVCGALSLGYVETLNRSTKDRRSVVTYVD